MENPIDIGRHDAAPLDGSELPPVMFLADHFGYSSGISHGLTTYFLHVLPALARAGVDLTVCFLREPHPAAEVLEAAGVSPIFLSTGKLDVLVPLRVAAIARERGCRILHASQIKATLVARMAARMTGAQTIVHVHDLNPTGAVVGRLHKLFSRHADLGLCVADAVQDLIINGYGVHRDRVRTLHNSVPLEIFRDSTSASRAALSRDLGIAPGSPVLALVGRMFPVKGQQVMLRMMPAIVARHPNAVLLLVGDGPERAACEELVRQLDLRRNVRILGQRNDIPALLSITDLLVMPSESEGLPLTAIEALASGCPVIGYDVGGMSEVLDDRRDGLLVAAGDVEAFRDAVLSLLDVPQQRSAYGAYAFAAAERFSLEHHVRGLLYYYRELASAAELPRARAASGA